MTDSPNKDFNPKHRVVGAIVLVALAVIVLPLILDRGHDAPLVDETEAPTVENQVFVADLTSTETTKDPTPAVVVAPTPVATPASAAASAPKPPSTAGASTVRAPQSAAAAQAPATPEEKGFYVQVGTFSSQANARHLADQLKQHGYQVRLEPVRLASGGALRVRVGPYPQQAQAVTARTTIQRKLNVQGIVRAY